MTADKIALFAALHRKEEEKKKAGAHRRVYLVWQNKKIFLKTSQWQDVSRSAMIVLAASV